MMKEQLLDFRDLGRKHEFEVVFLAQDRTNKVDLEIDDDEAHNAIDPEIGPMLMPSIAKVLNASVTVIAQTYIRNQVKIRTVGGRRKKTQVPVYSMRLGPNVSYITKIRSPKSEIAPPWLEDPSYRDVLEIIRGS